MHADASQCSSAERSERNWNPFDDRLVNSMEWQVCHLAFVEECPWKQGKLSLWMLRLRYEKREEHMPWGYTFCSTSGQWCSLRPIGCKGMG